MSQKKKKHLCIPLYYTFVAWAPLTVERSVITEGVFTELSVRQSTTLIIEDRENVNLCFQRIYISSSG